ncbi:hypothetical protein GCM10007416_31790 [Kroppenstedtia guangzhouensis]|uniref:Uncharacterized protein n=1 Tax=Kroppenstedtia guangzhouensis TaxID=1274356 RepID=A0ABQ1H3I4_9BACL|nr:hypothetical protein [Kroppenstedtia guangzhouensis]GGA56238.1 hypothetical protein GCM10007416_31790 [Kroppenstedtia guangzhouensis]
MAAVIPELKSITKHIQGRRAVEREIATLPKKDQKEMYTLMKRILKDELVFVLTITQNNRRFGA